MSRIDTERAIIGSLLCGIHNGRTNWNIKHLHANHFKDGVCRVIYGEIEKIHNWKGIDWLYISNKTGVPMSELAEFDMPTAEHLDSYIAQLWDCIHKDIIMDNFVTGSRKALLAFIDKSELTRHDVSEILQRIGEGIV